MSTDDEWLSGDDWPVMFDDEEEWPECSNCQDEGCDLCTPDCQED